MTQMALTNIIKCDLALVLHFKKLSILSSAFFFIREADMQYYMLAYW